MARKQTKNIAEIDSSSIEEVLKPESQVIVPHGIARVFDEDEIKMFEESFIKKFNVNVEQQKSSKKFIIFEDANQIAELDENDQNIEFYLNSNKIQLENWIEELKAIVTDPNLLIFFNVGKQNRTYMSYEAFFSQNGLAPKPCLINNWLDYHLFNNPTLTEEEIALKVNGNLKYSFSVRQI